MSRKVLLLIALTAAAAGREAHAQTDYYNTDAGRPVTIEDAYPVERYAFELQAAPLRVEREAGGTYHWEVEPEFAYGIFPRTQIEVGFPLTWQDGGFGRRSAGLAGIHVSMLHNLNVETRTLPALALAADVALPVGGYAADRTYASAKGVMTRTFGFARLHVNGRYTFGDADAAEVPEDFSRWLAGVAVDRTLPLRSMLITGEVYAREPLAHAGEVEWNAGLGTRYQWSPRLAVDFGLGKVLTAGGSWHLTMGAAYAFGIRALMPIR